MEAMVGEAGVTDGVTSSMVTVGSPRALAKTQVQQKIKK
jgi:hypothetical protein